LPALCETEYVEAESSRAALVVVVLPEPVDVPVPVVVPDPVVVPEPVVVPVLPVEPVEPVLDSPEVLPVVPLPEPEVEDVVEVEPPEDEPPHAARVREINATAVACREKAVFSVRAMRTSSIRILPMHQADDRSMPMNMS
jgi:hypothetical protein